MGSSLARASIGLQGPAPAWLHVTGRLEEPFQGRGDNETRCCGLSVAVKPLRGVSWHQSLLMLWGGTLPSAPVTSEPSAITQRQ